MDAVMSWSDHPVVDVRPDERVLWRRFARTTRLGATLARIWWPLWLPIVVLVWAGVPLLAAVALVVVAWVPAVVRLPRARARLQRMPLASSAAVFRVKWPKLCAQTGITAVVDGSLRCPRLNEIDFGGRWWRCWQPDSARLLVEPLGIQDEEAWPKMGRRIARQLHFATVTSLPVDELLEVFLYRARLPRDLRLGRDVPLSALTLEPGVVAVGLSSLGGPIRWCWDEPTRTSVAVGGGTGGGKGDFINKILGACRNLIETGDQVEVIVLDPKGMGDFVWARSFALILQEPVAMCRALTHVRAEMDRRREFMNRRDAASWTDLDPADQARLGRLVLIVDEFVSMANRTAEIPVLVDGQPTAKTVNLMPQALTDLQEITAQARAMRVNVLVATQHFIADTVPGKFGSTVISNLGARIGLGSLEAGGAATLFGKAQAETIAARSRAKVPGRMFYAALSDDDADHGAVMGQGWWAHPSFLRQLRASNPQVAHRDVMADPDRTPIGAEDLTDRPDPGVLDDDLAAELNDLTAHFHPQPPATAGHGQDPADDTATDTDPAPAAVLVDEHDTEPGPELSGEQEIVAAFDGIEPPDTDDDRPGLVVLSGGWDGTTPQIILGHRPRSRPTPRQLPGLGQVLTWVAAACLVISVALLGYVTVTGAWLWTLGGVR